MRWSFRTLCDDISGAGAMIKLRWYYPSPFSYLKWTSTYMLVEHFDRQLVLALQREDVGKLESSVFHVGQFSCQLKSTMTCTFLHQTFCCSVADPIKLFFFADEEFFHFFLLSEVVLLSMNFFSVLLTRKINSENWKMKKKVL